MNKSLSAAITTMLLVTSAAWATPESQGIRPMGDNQPDPSPTEQANQPNDPLPMDEERLKGDYREEQQDIERDVEQESLDEYENPEAAGDGDEGTADDNRE
ncbi:hypothetical protein [Marinobacter sp. OP 3.4]|uniref:hypothetical protein n=1 Tax=Marinobacter sp. OP 3.4 TaxID=3076501 RepID=UPI002E212D92